MVSASTAPAYVHYGRGGLGTSHRSQQASSDSHTDSPTRIGNIISTQTGSYRRPSHASDPRPPHLPTRRFSTGIGGYANISSLKPSSSSSNGQSPEDLHSLLSSTSMPGMVLSSSPSTHFGVGGYVNKYRESDDDVRVARENNEKYSLASLKVLHERRRSGGSMESQGGNSGNSGKSERSSRGNVVESLKDFLGGGRSWSSK